MTSFIICAGGPNPVLPQLTAKDYHIIGVDRGSLALISAGYTLDIAIGDFDSVSEAELSEIKKHSKQVIQYPAEKDATDFQMALNYIVNNFSEIKAINIYGALSGKGRIDHLLSNIWIAHDNQLASIISNLFFVEHEHQMRFLLPGNHQLVPETGFYYLSIITLSEVKQLKISGAKYELVATDYNKPCALISNEFVEGDQSVNLTFDTGTVMVMYVKYDR